MRLRRGLFPILLSCVLVLAFCDGPQVVFPRHERTAQVTGTILPPGNATMVSLSDARMVDSVLCDSLTGTFVFDSVAFGTYFLDAHAPGEGGLRITITVDQTIKTLGTYYLNSTPTQITGVFPPDSAHLDSAYLVQDNNPFTDSTAVIRIDFGYRMDTSSVAKALSVQPGSERLSTVWSSQSMDRRLEVIMPIGDFFRYPRHTLRLASKAQTAAGEPLDFDLVLTYFADTLSRPVVLRGAAVRSTDPVDGQKAVDPATDVVISFKNEMCRSSVEQAFEISPDAIPNFFWNTAATGRSTLTVRFASALKAGTRYVVRLDSTAATVDGETLPADVHFSFTTSRVEFTAYYPLDGHDSYPADSPFVYEATFALDSASFERAFSLEPEVDSVWFSFLANRRKAIVYHSPLAPDSHYTITVDSTLRSTTGGRYREALVQQFTAGTPLRPPDTTAVPDPGDTLIVSVTPSDTISTVSNGASPVILFADSMNVASVEQRLRIEPPVLFTTRWSSYRTASDRVSLNPLQVLRSATVYMLVIDSGYQSAAGCVGNRQEFTFKTEPILLTSYYPVEGQIRVPPAAAFELGFNTAIDSSTLLPELNLEPSVEALHVLSFSTSTRPGATSRAVIGHASLLPDTSYTLTLGKGVGDIYGGEMGRSYTITFRTGP